MTGEAPIACGRGSVPGGRGHRQRRSRASAGRRRADLDGARTHAFGRSGANRAALSQWIRDRGLARHGRSVVSTDPIVVTVDSAADRTTLTLSPLARSLLERTPPPPPVLRRADR